MSFQTKARWDGRKEVYKPQFTKEFSIIDYCHRSIESFYDEGAVTVTTDGVYIYREEPKNKVLAVAHLDTVQEAQIYGRSESFLYVPQLDDRLGVYALLDLLPNAFGMEFDLLLTEGEEVGRSTAKHFETDKKYNWIMEIDRAGTDVVMYQYETQVSKELMQQYGFEVGVGSFTDISYMDGLGVIAFNFGCGYYNHHSINAYVNLEEFEVMMVMLANFFHEYKGIELPYDEKDSIEYTYYQGWDWKETYTETTGIVRLGDSTVKSKFEMCVCKYCGMTNFTEDIKCYSCGEILDDETNKCALCDKEDCLGAVRCSGCEAFFHNCPFVTAFDNCSDCLQTMYDIDAYDIEQYELAVVFDNPADKNKFYWQISSKMAF